MATPSTNHLAHGATPSLNALVAELLDLADVDLCKVLDEYGPGIQEWCPIIVDNPFIDNMNDKALALKHSLHDQPLVLLALWLVSTRPCKNGLHIMRCELYRALKQAIALLQSKNSIDLGTLQLSMLIGIYEIGHAMHAAAAQSLASCAASLKLLDSQARSVKDERCIEIIRRLNSSMLMLDRMLPIAIVSSVLSVNISPIDPICVLVASKVGKSIPEHPQVPHPTSARKVHIRSIVALASGHVMQYIHSRYRELKPEMSYDQVDDIVSNCIKVLVDKPEPHTWLHCDAIAMAFCSHMLLQQSEMKHHSANMVHFTVPNSD
ncbi:hypothetical protein ACN47E_006134 [Coniothyrium glycines]